jgi:hypothetical protein
LRELLILRKLSEDDHNIFTTRLIDIILPDGVTDTEQGMYNLNNLEHLFLVMDLGERDLASLLKNH